MFVIKNLGRGLSRFSKDGTKLEGIALNDRAGIQDDLNRLEQ